MGKTGKRALGKGLRALIPDLDEKRAAVMEPRPDGAKDPLPDASALAMGAAIQIDVPDMAKASAGSVPAEPGADSPSPGAIWESQAAPALGTVAIQPHTPDPPGPAGEPATALEVGGPPVPEEGEAVDQEHPLPASGTEDGAWDEAKALAADLARRTRLPFAVPESAPPEGAGPLLERLRTIEARVVAFESRMERWRASGMDVGMLEATCRKHGIDAAEELATVLSPIMDRMGGIIEQARAIDPEGIEQAVEALFELAADAENLQQVEGLWSRIQRMVRRREEARERGLGAEWVRLERWREKGFQVEILEAIIQNGGESASKEFELAEGLYTRMESLRQRFVLLEPKLKPEVASFVRDAMTDPTRFAEISRLLDQYG